MRGGHGECWFDVSEKNCQASECVNFTQKGLFLLRVHFGSVYYPPRAHYTAKLGDAFRSLWNKIRRNAVPR